MSPAQLCVSHSRWFFSRSFFLATCVLLMGQTSTEKTLTLVVMVFRHGDRSPTKTYPKDMYHEDSWPDGFGQLTELGIEQHYELGMYLRKRYSGFLNETYSRHEVYVRSTDMDRTLMSAQANLAGLYPPVGKQVWNKNITWRPIPVHTVPLSDDHLLSMPLKNCPKYYKLQNETYKSKEFHDLVNPYKDFINSLQNETGYSSKELNEAYKWWTVYDALLCEQIHNYTLPDWATKDVMGNLSKLSNIGMSTLYGVYKHHEKSRLQGGVLVSSILKNITYAATKPSSNLKLMMYSGHDTTIAALQMALNVSNGKIPPYTACHIFELYKAADGEYTVEMYYRNDSSVDPYLITLPGCSSSCPLANFTELTSSIIVEDWEKECGAEVDENKGSGAVVRLTIVVVILSIVVLGLLVLLCYCRKTSSNYETV
ncbi:prostatic acid phosphatase [Hyla sarda]|uniref:prostatic acid phosphatase n=1 Tax=Hyla sarda TaxID=327740 RepID=UPI0024C2C96A|nr:prostatic acid phosphatase [Hyla sarda]